MNITTCILGVLLCITSIIGSIVPGIPGPQLAYLAIIITYFSTDKPFSLGFLIGWGIFMVLLRIIDYYLPILGTKKFGGTKRGNWGCIIGTIIGLFGGIFGIIMGPFIGAFIGEYLYKHKEHQALKAAIGSFIGFMTGIILKILVSTILTIYVCSNYYQYFYKIYAIS